jgi:outer membrane protein OmpA-like peptidoglycan-associated protein
MDTINVKQLSNITFDQPDLYFKITADSIIDTYTVNLPCESWSFHHDSINCKSNNPQVFNIKGQFLLTEAQMFSGICFCNSCSKASRIIHNSPLRHHYVSGKNCKGRGTITITNTVNKTKPDWLQKPITKGTKFSLNKLNFYPNKSKFMKSSYVELEHLLHLMNTRQELSIKIQGHVNGPKEKNIPAFQKLSENRAKAVYDYLVKNGIKQKRMAHQGFGNTKMQFPKPKDENEMKKNRRVEILIK